MRPLIAAAPTLISLDNFETINPEEQLLCKDFLAQRAHCSALITTRERIADTYLIPLVAMSPDEANEFLERLIRQTQDPDIYIEVNRHRILKTAEFNPLIIQWIVAQIDLAQDPEEVLSDLAHGEGEAAERVFDRSFNLPQMAEGGRAVLLALSLFMPSATRPMLAEVAGMGKDKDKKKFRRAQQTLASLWLMKQTNDGQRLTIEGLTRELAKARLSRDPRSKIFQQRYVSRFLSFVRANDKTTPADLNSLQAEKDNILNAKNVAFEIGEWQNAILMSSRMHLFLDLRGYWDEAIRCAEQALDAAREANNEGLAASFATDVASILANRGEYDSAQRMLQEAILIFRKLKDDPNLAKSLNNLGIIAQGQGEFVEARQLYDESLEIENRLNDINGVAKTLHNLGVIAQNQGDFAEARQLYNDGLIVSRKFEDQKGVAITVHQLGWLTHMEGDLTIAYQLYHEGLEIRKKLGDLNGIASSLHHLGMIAQERGGLTEARQLYNESLETAKKLGDQSGVATSLHQLGTLSLAEGDYQEADKFLNQSLTILRKLKDRHNIPECLESIGNLQVARNSFAEAQVSYEQALEMSQAIGDKFRIACVKHSLGLLLEKINDKAQAVQSLRESLSIFETLGAAKAETVRHDLERIESGESHISRTFSIV